MAQTGYTPISLYYSSTASAAPTAGNLVAGELALNTLDEKLYFKNSAGVVKLLASTSGASGDVVGPASATDNALARFDLTTGKLIQNSIAILSDAGALSGLTGVSSSSITDSGNLTFTGTGNRITGDFSNATIANRAMLQGSVSNSGTVVTAIPNGTSASAQLVAANASDPTNAQIAQVFVSASEASFRSAAYGTGTGTYLPMTFYTGGSERMRLDTSGNVGIGVSTVATNFRTQFLGTAGSNTSAASSGTTQAASAVLRLQAGGGFTATLDIGQGGGTGSWLQSCDTGNLATTYPLLLNPVGGNVGIGTSSPSSKLAVNGGTSTSQIRWEVNNAAFVNEVSTNAAVNAYVYKSNDASYHVWKLSSVEAMRIDSSGNLGIGFSSGLGTYGQLEVGGNANPTMALRSSTGSGTVFAMTAVGATEARINALTSVPMTFFTNNTERMRIDSSGNVGIGTSSPAAKLNVIGGRTFLSANNETYSLGVQYTSSTGQYYIGATNSATPDLVFSNVGGTERMRIDSSGNVGIGTTTPSSFAKFAVLQTSGSNAIQLATTTNGAGIYWNLTNAGGILDYSYGSYKISGTSDSQPYLFATNSSEKARLSASGDFLVTGTGTGSLGYGTGSGGTVTQATSRTTGVTLSKPTGAITMFSAAGSMVAATFTVTNTLVAATDTIILNQKSGTNLYVLLVTAVAAGSFNITFYTTGGVATDAPVINFAIIKGVTS